MSDLTREEILDALRPRDVCIAMLPDTNERFRSIVSTFDGAYIISEHPNVVNNLTIFKIHITSMYHLFALGAIFHIDKQYDELKEQHLAMALQADKNSN